MVSKFLHKIFGSRNERLLKRLRAVIGNINGLESAYTALSDDELRAKTGTNSPLHRRWGDRR